MPARITLEKKQQVIKLYNEGVSQIQIEKLLLLTKTEE